MIPSVLGHSVNFKKLYRVLCRLPVFPDYLSVSGNYKLDNLSTPHLSSHYASEFLAATQDALLFQYVQSPAHNRPNQKPTLIDLIFLRDDQTIANISTSTPLGKSHHKILRFHYTVDNNSKNERRRYFYHRANY